MDFSLDEIDIKNTLHVTRIATVTAKGLGPVNRDETVYAFSEILVGVMRESRIAFPVTSKVIPTSPASTASTTETRPNGTPMARSAFAPRLPQMF